MNPDLPKHVVSTIESVCAQGCTRVNEIIKLLESGKSVKEIEDLESSERESVLEELKKIMDVYKTS